MNEPKRRGRRPKAVIEQPIIDDAGLNTDDTPQDGENNGAQIYASKIWAGQSDHVPRVERLDRVRKALEGQGFSMEGVVL